MAKERKTVADLVGILAAETEAIEKLRHTRQMLEKELDSLAGEIAGLRGQGARAGRPKAKPKKKVTRKTVASTKTVRKPGHKTLRAAVAEILGRSTEGMRAAEIAEQLSNVGYTTTSKNVKNLVSALLPAAKEFKRVRKGLYALKKK